MGSDTMHDRGMITAQEASYCWEGVTSSSGAGHEMLAGNAERARSIRPPKIKDGYAVENAYTLRYGIHGGWARNWLHSPLCNLNARGYSAGIAKAFSGEQFGGVPYDGAQRADGLPVKPGARVAVQSQDALPPIIQPEERVGLKSPS